MKKLYIYGWLMLWRWYKSLVQKWMHTILSPILFKLSQVYWAVSLLGNGLVTEGFHGKYKIIDKDSLLKFLISSEIKAELAWLNYVLYFIHGRKWYLNNLFSLLNNIATLLDFILSEWLFSSNIIFLLWMNYR